MVRTKIEKPQDEIAYIDKETGRLTRIEYELKAYFEFDNELKKDVCIFEIQTFKEFSTFKYNLTVEVKKNRDFLNIKLLGISAPAVLFPHSGKANSKIKVENINGKYLVNIIKQDGTTNSFEFEINQKEKNVKFIKEIFSKKKKEKKFIKFLETE